MEAYSLVPVQSNPNVEEFSPGDTVQVNVKIREGDRERTQSFQGVIIRRRGTGPAASFTARRVSHGIGVERTFLLYSPTLESLKVLRRGKVRRAKLYYLRGRVGKAARIKEKSTPRE